MSDPKNLVVLGGGEHARIVIETARSRPDLWSVVGFVDPRPCEETARRLGVRWLGGDESGLALAKAADHWFTLGFGAVGSLKLRRVLADRYDAVGAQWASLVHAHSWSSPTARVAPGAQVLAGAVVNGGAVIGAHCVINTGAIVEHDVELGAFVHAAPGATIGGGARIGEGAYLGLGCCVRDHVRIGREVLVGMGAVVVDSVPDHETVGGLPARPLARDE